MANRYVVTLDAYVYAENDEQAKKMCEQYKAALNELDDCRPAILSLCEQPFGRMYNRPIAV